MNDINVDKLLQQMRSMASQAGMAEPDHAAGEQAANFGNLLKQAIDKVNETQQSSQELVTAFERGDPNVNVAEVMIAMQKAKISFEAMVQVRNRLVSAYQEIMGMSI